MRRIERKALARLRLHGRQNAPNRIVAVARDAVALVVDRHQVADLVVFIPARDDGRRTLSGRLRQQPSHRVIPELADERTLRAGDHPVRLVPLDALNTLAVQTGHVQYEIVQDAAVRQRRLHAVADFIFADDIAAAVVALERHARNEAGLLCHSVQCPKTNFANV